MQDDTKIKTLLCIALSALILAAALVFASVRIYKGKSDYSASISDTIPQSSPQVQVQTETADFSPVLRSAEMTDDGVDPSILLSLCPYEGENVECFYETRNYYYGGEGSFIKRMVLYIPYGYNENEKYDVLVLLHGLEGTENYWLSETRPYRYRNDDHNEHIYIKNLLDNMICSGYCKPVIVASITFYLNDSWREGNLNTSREAVQLSNELVYDILPYIAENYSTYAGGTSRQELSEARDHFGFYGASYGSILMMRGPLCDCLDVVANFGAVSGNTTSCYYMQTKWAENGFSDLPINYFYFSSGTGDQMRSQTLAIYNEMKENGLKIDGSNSCYVDILSAIHEDRVWCDGIYNCLIKFFN